jgi:hypothetical protein
VLWGLGMGVHESVLAAVPLLVRVAVAREAREGG